MNDPTGNNKRISMRTMSSMNLGSDKGDKPHHSLLGISFIMLGSFAFSVMFLFVKLMADANTFTLVFYRAICEIVIAIIDIKRKGDENLLGPDDPSIRFWLVVRGATGAIAVCAFFFGIQLLPLPDAVTLQFTTPPFAAAFAVCMVGEKWKLLDVIGAIVCLSGVACIAHPTVLFGPTDYEDSTTMTEGVGDNEAESESSSFFQVVAVLVTTGGAAMAGLAYVTVRKIGNRASAELMVLYFGVLSIPITFVGSILLADGEWQIWGKTMFSFKDICLLLVIGISSYAGQFFINLGLQHETAATATLATSTQIVWTYIFELLFLHEALDPWSMGGTGLILGYMLIVAAIKLCTESSYIQTEETELLPFAHSPQDGSKLRNFDSFNENDGN